MRAKDGSLRQVIIDSSALFEGGKFVHTRCFTRDISERKRAEDLLRRSEERFRALVNASSDVVYRMSPDWSEMRQLDGKGFIADTGKPRKDWLNEYIDVADQPLVLKSIREAVRTKSMFELDTVSDEQMEPWDGPTRGRFRCLTQTVQSWSGSVRLAMSRPEEKRKKDIASWRKRWMQRCALERGNWRNNPIKCGSSPGAC